MLQGNNSLSIKGTDPHCSCWGKFPVIFQRETKSVTHPNKYPCDIEHTSVQLYMYNGMYIQCHVSAYMILYSVRLLCIPAWMCKVVIQVG